MCVFMHDNARAFPHYVHCQCGVGREAVKRSAWVCPYLLLLDMNTVHSHAVSVQPEPFNSAHRLPFLLLHSPTYSPLCSLAVTLAFPVSPPFHNACAYPAC